VRRILGRRQLIPLERLCALLKKGRINHMILLEEKVVREDVERRISEARGVGIIKVRDLIFIVFIVERMDMKQRHVGSHGRRSKKKQEQKEEKGKALNPLILLLLIAILA
jgi:hypothetical protein